jgi:putative solute:sodium symporter small subunit
VTGELQNQEKIMEEKTTDDSFSFFRPRGANMQSETRVIKLILTGWLIAIVGYQLLAYLLEVNYSSLLLDDMTLLNLPIHFWLTGQFLPLWFIILCILFNLWMDRNAASTASLDGSIRFRVKSTDEEDE